jgi:PKD repeat protein
MARPCSLRVALVLLLAAGCGDDDQMATADAAASVDAAPVVDAAVGADGIEPLAWVDFAITGCESDSAPVDAGQQPPCTGEAPLELRFTALSPAPIEVYRWELGDGSESTAASPLFSYAAPGVYDVALTVGGPGGTASKSKTGIVVVRAAALGSPCDDDGQCGTGLDCACDDAAGCGPVLPAGLCSATCDETTPCADGVCADLDAAGAGGADWRRGLCLIDCASDPCPAGLACRELPAPGGGWVAGCFQPGVLGDIGDACRDADGQTDDAACATGHCVDLGARALCAAPCTGGDCPGSAACATFTDGSVGPICVARCDDGGDCTGDPWLACEAAGGAGTKSFTVDETPDAGGYCAPKTCTMADDCGTDGACVDDYCAAP